jgi:hypothetical protein
MARCRAQSLLQPYPIPADNSVSEIYTFEGLDSCS